MSLYSIPYSSISNSSCSACPRYHTIGRCNNYVMLQSIPCSPECKIVKHILLDHPLSYALTATADVPVVYLQQLWRTVSKVFDIKDTIKFMLDTKKYTYTVDMFRVILHLLVETPENPFVAPVNFQTIEAFMNRVGYQAVVDKVQRIENKAKTMTFDDVFAFIENNVFQKKEAIHYPRFIKLIIADLMKKFLDISQRFDEDYHSIKDDTLLVSVYTTGNVLVRGMLIPDAFLTEEIRATDDFKEYETVSPRKSLRITIRQKQVVEGEKDDDDFEDRLEPESHKENPEYVDDDVDEEKVDEEKDVDTGSLETRTGEMQTPIPTPPRSPRINLSSDNITQELKDIGPLPTSTTSKTPHSKRLTSSKYSHLPGALRRMCRRQGYMIQNTERKCVTTNYFWKTHKTVDRVLHEIVLQLAEKATDDLIENNLKPSIVATIIEDRDAFHLELPDLVHPTITTSTETTSSADLQQQLYLKMKRSLQYQANDPVLWEVLKRKFKKSSTSNTSCRDDNIHSQRHDDHQEDDAPPDEEKRVKRHKASESLKFERGSSSKHSAKDFITYVSKQQQHEWDAWVEETVIDDDEVILEDETPELITKLQNVDKHVPTIFDRARMEATLNDMLINQFKNAKELAYHLEQSTNFMEEIV
ncbi:hypothetical protein Tco_0904144 [Tanacetum coccineum]